MGVHSPVLGNLNWKSGPRSRGERALVGSSLKTLFGALLAQLADPNAGEFISAKEMYTVGLELGLDMDGGDVSRRAPTLKTMKTSFDTLPPQDQSRAIDALTNRLVQYGQRRLENTIRILKSHGYEWVEGTVLSSAAFDPAEATFLPPTSVSELRKAVGRLNAGDESGAISSACGAVDLVTGAAYEKHGLGDPGKSSFSTKVNTALQQLAIFDEMEKEFLNLGLDANDASAARKELEAAINHAGQAMQVLRRRMGDVHGSRPALRSTAYDCIRFASAICALFEGRI